MEKITYTKKDIINKVSKKLNIHNDEVKFFFESVLQTMSDILCEENYLSRIEIRNFGVFEVKPTKAKPKARNPRTNEEIYVPVFAPVCVPVPVSIPDFGLRTPRVSFPCHTRSQPLVCNVSHGPRPITHHATRQCTKQCIVRNLTALAAVQLYMHL